MDKICIAYYKSPIGVIEVTGTKEGILSVGFGELAPETEEVPGCLQECIKQLDEYFAGKRSGFSLILRPEGTDFQRKVWNALREIPYGETSTYTDIAGRVGNAKAVRAVGGANNKNKIGIIIPCHRVIGKDGSLIGYAGGLWRKEWLLAHEKQFTANGSE